MINAEIAKQVFLLVKNTKKAEVKSILLLCDKHCSMAHIPGVTIKKNANGKVTHVTIDVERRKELAQPVLERLGIMDNEDHLTLEESFDSTLVLVDQLFNTDEKRKN